MMTTTIKALMTHVAPGCSPAEQGKNKISVIGAGTVGTTIAFVLIAQVSFLIQINVRDYSTTLI